MKQSKPVIFSGNSNPPLATAIANKMQLPLGDIQAEHFNDGEIRVEINESVRGRDVFVVQSTSTPVNDNLMEMLVIGDALRRAHANRVIAIMPYYGYARQDRCPELARTPITSRLVADMIQASGIDYVVTVDIHSAQQQGFFNIPFTNISAGLDMVADIWRRYSFLSEDLVIVSPDVGGVARARTIAKQLDNTDLVIVDKRRQDAGVSEVMNIIGNVEGKNCVIIDDMIDTAGTLCKAASALKAAGAQSVAAYATHGVFSGNAYTNIGNSELDTVTVTNSIPLPPCKEEPGEDGTTSMVFVPDRIKVLSIACMLSETIKRITDHESVSDLFLS